jgi:hypothetical protein
MPKAMRVRGASSLLLIAGDFSIQFSRQSMHFDMGLFYGKNFHHPPRRVP